MTTIKDEPTSADVIAKMIRNVKSKDQEVKKGVDLANIAEELTKRKAKNIKSR